MASSRVSFALAATAVVWLAAQSNVGAANAASAAPPSASASSNAADVADLTAEIQAQVSSMVPDGMRVDHVMLGCNPPPHASLKTVAPGFPRVPSRAFMVELQQGDQAAYCSVTMDASRQVLIAIQDIQSGAAVSEADFRPEWVDAFGGAPGALLTFPAGGPYVSAIAIRTGQALYQSSLTRPLAVRPGELVTVLVKNGPVTLHAQLLAQSQASIGDTITVINPSTETPVMVTLTGPQSAELVLP